MLPDELQRLLDQTDASEREAEALVSDLSEADVNWQAQPGLTWSVAQCLDHLTVMNEFYLRTFPALIDQARQRGGGRFAGLSPTAMGRLFIANVIEPPPRFKTKTPKQAVPRSNLTRAQLVPNFKASHEIYRQMVQSAAEVDVNAITGPNPFFNLVKMRVSTVLLIIPAHDRRHLWQAGNVKRSLRSRS
jgi:hypothetical protein